MTTYYKTLRADGLSPVQNAKWHLPTPQPDGTYKPGRWMPRLKSAEKCVAGYHACKREHLVRWLDDCIYELEYDGEPECDDEKCWGTRARLLRPLTTWDERTARLFACDCAEAVLLIWEKCYPDDRRPHEAIAVARQYANGEATGRELAAARAAAWAAAGDAAWAAAWAAAGDAARAAAGDAAGAAARAAAGAAAGAAARAAAGAAARAAQTDLLFDYLEGGKS